MSSRRRSAHPVALVTFVVAGLLFAACTPETAPTTIQPATTSTSTTSTTKPAPTDHLEIWVDDVRKAVLDPFVAEFADQAGVSVDVVAYPFDEIAAAVLAGNGPDIFLAAHDRLGSLLAAGAIAPVDLGTLDLDAKAVAAVSADGVTYGVPYGLESVALYVNVGALGGDVAPETFASLETVCAPFDGCVGVPEGLYHQYGFLSSSGGYVFGSLPGGAWSVDDIGLAGAVDGAKALANLAATGVVATGPYSDVVERFVSGETPFLITGPWQVRPFTDAGVDFAVHPLPTLDGRPLRPFVGVQAFFVSADAPPGLAESFVREVLARPEVLTAAAMADNRVPAVVSARSGIDPALFGFTASVEGGDLLPGIPEMVAVWNPLDAALDAIFAGMDPQVALADAEEQIRSSRSR